MKLSTRTINKQYAAPKYTIWGKLESPAIKLAPGIYCVATPNHAGIMINKNLAKQILSADTLKYGIKWLGWRCFDENCAMWIVVRELLDNPKWRAPKEFYSGTREGLENFVDNSIQELRPSHWNNRFADAGLKAASGR